MLKSTHTETGKEKKKVRRVQLNEINILCMELKEVVEEMKSFKRFSG